MSNSNTKTLGLSTLALVILALFVIILPLIIWILFSILGIPGVVIGGGERFILIAATLIPIVFLAIWIIVIVWIYRDAENRGMSGILWALLVLVGNIVGLIIYLIVRDDNFSLSSSPGTIESCPTCNKAIDQKYIFCPYCGIRTQNLCPNCKKPVSNDWQLCPYCSQPLTSSENQTTLDASGEIGS